MKLSLLVLSFALMANSPTTAQGQSRAPRQSYEYVCCFHYVSAAGDGQSSIALHNTRD
jgi:hypothetical protein